MLTADALKIITQGLDQMNSFNFEKFSKIQSISEKLYNLMQ